MDNDIEHFAFPLPFTKELTLPYRARPQLQRKVDYVFSHISLPQDSRQVYLDVSQSGSRGLVNDMSRVAIALVREFMDNPTGYGGKMENIYLQVLVRMWKLTFLHCKLQQYTIDKYYAVKLRTLAIDNGLWDELIRVVNEQDYVNTNAEFYKGGKVEPIKARDIKQQPTQEFSKRFEYYAESD